MDERNYPTISVSEVAEILGISRNGVYEALRAGEMPGLRLGRRWVIPRERFWRWFNGDGLCAPRKPEKTWGAVDMDRLKDRIRKARDG